MLQSLSAKLNRLNEVREIGALISEELRSQLVERIQSQTGREVSLSERVDSEIVGVEKPDPAIFQIALDALRVPASRCVYIGDSVHFDVHGARAAGLHPVHVDPHELCGDPTHPHAASVSQFTDSFLASKD